MPLRPINPLPTKSARKIHERNSAIYRHLLYSVNYLQLTSTTLPTSDKDHTYPTNQTLKMNSFLLFVTYNSAPVPKGNKYVANTKAKLGALASASGSYRCCSLPREEARLRGSGTPVYLQATQRRLPGRDGLDHAALRAGMAGRAARLIRTTHAITAHFDASTGTMSHTLIVPVLLSGFRKEEGDVSADARGDADRAHEAWFAPQPDPFQEQVTRLGQRVGGRVFRP